ncbi:hypothetical protein C7B65_15645 [Phormidesmis priestleyi ULC007]|uniref:Uncharacterized protein n=1 Tax=Phormidesmis priestleyi ULC007 TaxID=1920490 RepID=A0A2T1DCU4_9CYAN|nr:hypothetical protein [Phormidesmis priestleyi]PSB18330.1 hypothetical protein C7B65_15645 [Phormidesmis priestleyi ULC007]PZO46590.1 MAG: hypothetical protein DCF14_22415 [Phormidesmis priestleyi]
MTSANYNDLMSLDELRHYVLTNREDLAAFQVYIDRSKASGRMISIDPKDAGWERFSTSDATSNL